jgi:hypothetical protein
MNLSFPSYMTDTFTPVNSVQGSMGMLISFDCMLQGYKFEQFAGSIDIFKIVLTGIFPFLFLILYLVLWSSLTPLKYFRRTFKRNIAVSLIITFFFLYPSITSNTFRLFKCFELDQGVSRLQMDMNLECWGKDHLFFALSAGVPMIVLWIIGIPVIGFLVLTFN